MLEKLGVIQSQISKETQQFLEEYGIYDEDELEESSPSKELSKPGGSRDAPGGSRDAENKPSEGEQENIKLAKELKAKQREIEMREKKLQISHFHVDELEADYLMFMEDHFDFVDKEVIKLL